MPLHHYDRSTGSASPGTIDDKLSGDVPRVLQTRGVTWVVKWSAALAMLASSSVMLMEFGYLFMAEQTLARAARAGVIEATLPNANHSSVEQTVWRRLRNWNLVPNDLTLHLAHNATAVHGKFLARGGDRFSITVAVATEAILPTWLRALRLHKRTSLLIVEAEARMPGGTLPGHFSVTHSP